MMNMGTKLTKIAQYWRHKLKNKKSIDFPSKLCDAIAGITDDFSFAYLKEAFVATLLDLARTHDGDDDEDEASGNNEANEEDDPLDKYEFWRAFKAQVKILRKEMGNDEGSGDEGLEPQPRVADAGISSSEYVSMAPMLEKMRLQGSSHKAASPRGAAGTEPSARSPIDAFVPLAQNRSAGVWEWGTSQ